MRYLIVLLLFTFVLGCNQTKNENPHVLITTNLGEIEIEVFSSKAPISSAAFLSFVDSGFYTKSSFYRVIMQEGLSTATNTGLIQGGIWQTNDKKHPILQGIIHESTLTSGLSHVSGTVSLARTKPGTATSEFFICIGDQTQFNYGNKNGDDSVGFAAFGSVIKGMSIVRKIQEQRRHNQDFDEKIIIDKIERL